MRWTQRFRFACSAFSGSNFAGVTLPDPLPRIADARKSRKMLQISLQGRPIQDFDIPRRRQFFSGPDGAPFAIAVENVVVDGQSIPFFWRNL
jgi:hypothetical protein